MSAENYFSCIFNVNIMDNIFYQELQKWALDTPELVA